MSDREGVTTYFHPLYSPIRVFQHALLRAEIWPYIVFRCARMGDLGGIGLRICWPVVALYPLPRSAWHVSASNQHYAFFYDGFSLAEHVARLLD